MKIGDLSERAPSSNKGQRFLQKAKKSFKKQYGTAWKRVLYATAWKMFGESLTESLMVSPIPSKKLVENYSGFVPVDFMPGDNNKSLDIINVNTSSSASFKVALKEICDLSDESKISLKYYPKFEADYNIAKDFGFYPVSFGMIRNPLNEGLIKVPENILDHFTFLATYNILHWVKSKFTPELKEQYPRHWQEIGKLASELGVGIPNTPYRVKNNLFVEVTSISSKHLPDHYPRKPPAILYFCISWDRSPNLGAYIPDRNIVMIYPMSNRFISDYPNEHFSQPSDLRTGILQIKATIEHELRHAVQYIIFDDHPKQRNRIGDYNDENYYNSPIEFDPLIGSAISDFITLWDSDIWERKQKPTFEIALKKYVGAISTDPSDIFYPPKFFVSLRKKSFRKYKAAVKKFLIDLERIGGG